MRPSECATLKQELVRSLFPIYIFFLFYFNALCLIVYLIALPSLSSHMSLRKGIN